MLGVAVFGAGRIGAVHASTVARSVPGARLVGVADVDAAAAERVIAGAGSGRATGRYEELLADPDVQAVIVATPTGTHASMVEEATRAGKHILCEKPIAFTLAEAERAVAATEAAGVLLQMGFMLRFDAPFTRAREAIARGDIGEPWIVRLTMRDPRLSPLSYLKTSGGQLKDQAVHAFDVARWLVGREVEEVYATGSVPKRASANSGQGWGRLTGYEALSHWW